MQECYLLFIDNTYTICLSNFQVYLNHFWHKEMKFHFSIMRIYFKKALVLRERVALIQTNYLARWKTDIYIGDVMNDIRQGKYLCIILRSSQIITTYTLFYIQKKTFLPSHFFYPFRKKKPFQNYYGAPILSSKGFLKKDKTCAAIFQPHNNGHFLCIAVAQKNFIIKLQNNMMNERD